MSTFLVAGSPGSSLETVVATTGGALQGSGAVEMQINQATSVVTDSGSTRQIQKNEVLLIVNLFMQYIERMNWPFATS